MPHTSQCIGNDFPRIRTIFPRTIIPQSDDIVLTRLTGHLMNGLASNASTSITGLHVVKRVLFR